MRIVGFVLSQCGFNLKLHGSQCQLDNYGNSLQIIYQLNYNQFTSGQESKEKINTMVNCFKIISSLCMFMHYVWICSSGGILISQAMTWHAANQYCIQTYGSHLINCGSSSRNAVCKNLCPTPGICWIGAHDEHCEGTWEWASHCNPQCTSISYTNCIYIIIIR